MTKVEELQTALLLFIAGQLAIANADKLSHMSEGRQLARDVQDFRAAFDELRGVKVGG